MSGVSRVAELRNKIGGVEGDAYGAGISPGCFALGQVERGLYQKRSDAVSGAVRRGSGAYGGVHRLAATACQVAYVVLPVVLFLWAVPTYLHVTMGPCMYSELIWFRGSFIEMYVADSKT